MRLDAFMVENYPEYSRSVWQKFIKLGRVSVDGRTEVNPAKNVAEENFIKFSVPEKDDFSAKTLPVIYEDENVVVINKPAGVLTHSKGALNDEFTVAEYIKTYFTPHEGCSQREGSENNRLGIVHRLDRATSGVMIGAKNDAAQRFLQKQFSDRRAKKTYLALVERAPKQAAARIDLPIARNPKKPAEFRIDPKGKPAITDYKTLKTFADGSALLELKPLTGRTHQLRVHLAYIGAPIVGDVIYNSPNLNIRYDLIQPTSVQSSTAGSYLMGMGVRMFLHAASLEITIPAEPVNLRKTFTADLPDDFRSEIAKRRGK
jgi:23S rRNA pseudouridine1911/1915/1917 synthase